MKLLGILFLVMVVFVQQALACTTFCMEDGDRVVFGRNYDWDVSIGYVMINKRNISKIALPRQTEKSAKWISKYGSVTFNQYGREFPTGGINETGLVVELMMLEGSEYPSPDRRPVVGPLEWIQYQLDNSATIAEVLKASRSIRISSSVKLHYLVCEHSGACITAEFLEGRFVPHYGSSLPIAVLTNDTYDHSLQYLNTLVGFGGSAQPTGGFGSLERLGRAATMMRNYQPGISKDLVSYAFDILSNVAQGDFTKWSIVYDLTNLRVYFRTLNSQHRKRLDLAKLDFSCASPVKLVNIDTVRSGKVLKRLRKYSTDINRNLVRDAYKSTPFLSNTPDAVLEMLALHPETFSCQE